MGQAKFIVIGLSHFKHNKLIFTHPKLLIKQNILEQINFLFTFFLINYRINVLEALISS
jgi:hypothetical protein